MNADLGPDLTPGFVTVAGLACLNSPFKLKFDGKLAAADDQVRGPVFTECILMSVLHTCV